MTTDAGTQGNSNQSAQTGLQPQGIFQTPLWIRRVVDFEARNAEIMSHLPALQQQDGEQRSNMGGWHSTSQLHLDERLAPIRKIIGTTCVQCAVAMDFNFDAYDLVLNEMWINVNGPGHSNKAHIHAGSFLSGAYYVQVPENSGNIEIYDPVIARVASPYPVRTQSVSNANYVAHKCAAGDLVIFPGWLQHGVQMNESIADRVSISFNMVHRPRTHQSTE